MRGGAARCCLFYRGDKSSRDCLQELFDIGRPGLLFGGESNADEVIAFVRSDGLRFAEAGDSADGDFSGAAAEAEVNTITAFRVQLGDDRVLFGVAPVDLAAQTVVDSESLQ